MLPRRHGREQARHDWEETGRESQESGEIEDYSRSLLASACMNLVPAQASSNSGASHASCGRTLSTTRTSDAKLFLWMWRARKRPMYPSPPTIRTEGFSAMIANEGRGGRAQ